MTGDQVAEINRLRCSVEAMRERITLELAAMDSQLQALLPDEADSHRCYALADAKRRIQDICDRRLQRPQRGG